MSGRERAANERSRQGRRLQGTLWYSCLEVGVCSEAILKCLYTNMHQTERVMMQSLGYRKIVKVFPYMKTFWVALIHTSLGEKEDDRSRFVAVNLPPGLLMKCLADQHSDTVCWLSCPSTFIASQLPQPLKKSWFISLGNLYIWVRTEYLHVVSETFSRQIKSAWIVKALKTFHKGFQNRFILPSQICIVSSKFFCYAN